MQRFLFLLCALVLAGCSGSKPTAEAQQYRLQGQVIRLDPQTRTAVIKHGKIAGWMEAMTMEFPVHDAKDFEKLAAGKRITATVYVSGDVFWIGNVQPAPVTQ